MLLSPAAYKPVTRAPLLFAREWIGARRARVCIILYYQSALQAASTTLHRVQRYYYDQLLIDQLIS